MPYLTTSSRIDSFHFYARGRNGDQTWLLIFKFIVCFMLCYMCCLLQMHVCFCCVCADDTQLFFSFHPLNFDSSISHLQNTLQQISSWMTANLLTHSFSETEFLLIGLKKQLAKIHNSSLDTSHSAWNLGFIFDEHLTFADQITALSKACYYHNRQLRCIRPYLDSSTACTIATSIVHSKLDYCNSLYYKLPKSQLCHLQQIQNSLARTVVKAPKSCHITPILRSLHWLNISERIEYKLLSLTYNVPQLPNLRTFIISCPLNVLAVLALHPSLLLLGHLHHHLLK